MSLPILRCLKISSGTIGEFGKREARSNRTRETNGTWLLVVSREGLSTTLSASGEVSRVWHKDANAIVRPRTATARA